MGDIHPYGPPAYSTWQEVYNEAYTWFADEGIAATFAAIASAESGLDWRVINDTPSTGDYSVGEFQINYFNGLYAERAAAYGTPKDLVDGGLSRQFYAARGIYASQGFNAWSTYTNGAYRHYLHGYNPSPPGQGPGQHPSSPKPPIGRGIDAWDGQVRQTADATYAAAQALTQHAQAIAAI